MALGFAGWELFILIELGVIFLAGSGIGTFVIMSRLRWPFIIEDVEDLAGKGYTYSRKDRGRLVAFGDGGEELFQLKRKKVKRVAYGKRVGLRRVLFARASDGYYYNVSYGDLNTKLLEMGLKPTHAEARLMNTVVRKGIDLRYDDKTWFEKHSAVVYFGLFLISMMVFGAVLWMSFDKNLEIAQANAEGVKVSKEVMELAKQVLSGVASVRQDGSGLVPA